jgi:hypothetical protein
MYHDELAKRTQRTATLSVALVIITAPQKAAQHVLEHLLNAPPILH